MLNFRRPLSRARGLFSCLLLLATGAAGVDAAAPPEGGKKVGLALSGGGARGLAHVGVLRVLEEEGVPIDFVAGTSMGAVVGGLYAAGVPLDEIERLAVELDWRDALKDQVRYRQLPFRRKEDQELYRTALRLGLGEEGLAVPGGLLSGQKLEAMLRLLLAPAAGITDFSHLPIPFRAVAADLETGEQVILAKGDLAESIRASLAIPGMFTPVEIEGRLLADGGIANNLPVDVVREMGADLVIAVDISEPLLGRENLQTAFGILAQTLSFLIRNNMEPQLELADLVITPNLEGYGVLSFREARSLVDAGFEAVDAQRRDLAPFVVSGRRSARARGPLEVPGGDLAFLRIEGCSRVDERVVRSLLRTREGEPLDLEVLDADLQRIYALEEFREVSFELVQEGDERGLALRVEEKDRERTVLRLGLGAESDLESRTIATASFGVTTRRLNARGGEWRNELQLGTDFGLLSELYQPLSFSRRFFVAPTVGWRRWHQGVWSEGGPLDDLELEELLWRVDVGLDLGIRGELRAGIFGGRLDPAPEPELRDLFPEVSGKPFDLGGFRLRLRLDTLDRPSFPSRGLFLRFDFLTSQESLGADREIERARLELGGFTSWGRHTLGLHLQGGSSLGSELSFEEQFRLGGPFRLGFLGADELRGQLFGYAGLLYSYRVAELPSALGEGVFFGSWWEVGNVWQRTSRFGEDLLWSGSIFVGAETLLGPLTVGYSRGEGGRGRYHLVMGRTF